jgi:hypothetical protein
MKNIILAAASIFAVITGTTGSAYAQQASDQLLAYNYYPNIESPVPAERMNASNTKALRAFKKENPNVTKESWYAHNDGGYRVKFLKDGLYQMSDYSAKGNWLRTISTYGENRLPRNIREKVKSQYFDYNIFLVQEITMHNSKIYLVSIEDKKSWMTLRVTEDEMEVIEDLVK